MQEMMTMQTTESFLRQREALALPDWLPRSYVNTGQILLWLVPNLSEEMARDLIARVHPDNRRVNDTHLKRLATSMSAGQWKETAEPFVRLDAAGWVVDGQHRLVALIRSKVSLRNVSIAQLLSPDAISYIDTQRRLRSANDLLKMQGETTQPRTVIAALALASCDLQDLSEVHRGSSSWRSGARSPLTDSMLVQNCEPDILQLARNLHRASRGGAVPAQSGLVAAAVRCARKSSALVARTFFVAVAHNNPEIDGQTSTQARALTNHLLSIDRQSRKTLHTTGGFPQQVAIMGAAIKSWNAWRRGRPQQSVRFLLGTEVLSEPEP